MLVCLAGVTAERVYLYRVACNTVWSHYGRWCSVALKRFLKMSYAHTLTLITFLSSNNDHLAADFLLYISAQKLIFFIIHHNSKETKQKPTT